MTRLFEACQHQNEEIVDNALQCLREITTQEYESMTFYFEKICAATSALSKHPSMKVGAQAFEYWTTLVEDETERTQKGVNSIGYVRSCADSLIDMIIEGLCIINFDEDDDDEDWGHALSAACCLQKLSILIRNDVMDKIVSFASMNINSPNWKQRYSALVSLGSITEGPEKDKFLTVLSQALSSLIPLFEDKVPKVREALFWLMHRISEFHSEVFQDNGVSTELIPRILEGLKDRPRVSNQCCAAFEKLAEGQQPNSPE